MEFLNNVDELPKHCKIAIFCEGFDVIKLKSMIRNLKNDIRIVYYSKDQKYIYEKIGKTRVDDVLDCTLIKKEVELILISTESWLKLRDRLKNLNKEIMLIDKIRYKDHIISTQDFLIYGEYYSHARKIFKEGNDQRLYDLILKARTGKPNLMLKLQELLTNSEHLKMQYLDFIDRNDIKTIIEGGVYKGKNTVEFLENFPKDVAIYGFEPLLGEISSAALKYLMESQKNVKLYKYGLWSKKDRLAFFEEDEDKPASRLIRDNTNLNCKNIRIIKTISIDEFVEEHDLKKVDYIKLDIEGAELNALKGAVNTLERHRPQLAICIYHSKKDIFEIPIFLSKILKHYSYRLGHYSETYYETVLYCMPNLQ